MPTRFVLPAVVAVLLIIILIPVRGDDRIHRDGFAKNSDPAWFRGDANIHFIEKTHKIDDEHARNAGTSELIKIEANPAPGATSAEYVHYYYEIPPAAVSVDLAASVYVKSFRSGIQLKARVVLPKEKDPKNPDAPLTTLVSGDVYRDVQKWRRLSMGDVSNGLKSQLAALTAKLGRVVDETDAYVDHLVLNVYGGTGVTEVWIDDLSVGPVLPREKAGDPRPGGRLEARTRKKPPAITFSNGDILIDMHDDQGERPFFMRAIRHSGVPLAVLEQARFNTLWFPNPVSDEVYEEAVRAKFFLVPTLPLPQSDWDPTDPKQAAPATLEKDAELVAQHFRKFLASDAVLMWDLGSGRTTDQVRRVARLAETVRTYDPRRPRAIDLWDGYAAYSNYVDAIGAHRWPLFTSLEVGGYKDWLTQRRVLTGPGKLSWTWIQTHLPEWYLGHVHGDPACTTFPAPIGPHPEQIRILTYLALAAGYRGLGYWSDQFLADSTHGQDRLLEIALLNAEMELLEPVLLAAQDPARWIPTSHPHVQAAIIRGAKETVVLPVWLGPGTQHCPDQMTVGALTVNVPLIPNGATAWRITPAAVEEIKDLKYLAEGTRLVIPEFDTATAIVFTTDVSSRGRVVRWQENTRQKLSRTVAYWARQQAYVQYEKVKKTHAAILAAGGPDVPDSYGYFCQAERHIREASKYTDNLQPDLAYLSARRALRPLRILMREHWRQATETLDAATASPYAVGFYSLPKHWELHRRMTCSRPGGDGLAHGGFELSEAAPADGAAVSSLPGWKPRRQLLDSVQGSVALINTDTAGVPDPPVAYDAPRIGRYDSTGRPVPTAADRKMMLPKPNLGRHCLRLAIVEKPGGDGVPLALERSFVAVDSPPVEFAPGTWVRIGFWAKVPYGVQSSADGVLIYDSSGGEPLSVRLGYVPEWKRFSIYRPMPASGKLTLTFALTGLGLAYFDDVKVEPMIPGSGGVTTERWPEGTPKPLPPAEDTRTLPFPRGYPPQPEPKNPGAPGGVSAMPISLAPRR
jgi:hypothetical protein